MSQLRWFLACLAAFIPATALAQQPKPKAMVGAYYFDGWSGGTDEIHITKLLTAEYADRKPVWGWKDDTVEIMQKQIDYCADHDIAFWAFDWYYPEGKAKTTPLNNALGLYLKAPNCQRMKFCLLVANHEGFRIGPKDWDACCDKWIELFQKPTHLRLDSQPLLIFFSPDELQKAFGSVEGVRKAFDSLRSKAKKAGLLGVSIAACTGPGGHLGDLSRSGYTLLTGYNYPLGWHNGGGSQPFRKLIEGSERIFNQFAEQTPLPYVPVITAGWDRRPWEQGQMPPEKMSVWYPDRTPKLVEEFVRLGVNWIDKHPDKTTPQRLLLIYAWNENGEGGYLTPTEKDGSVYLKAVQRAISGEPKLVQIDAKDKNGADFAMRATETKRGDKTSTIKVIRKKMFGSVGSSMFVVQAFYEIAKARKCEYFVNLKEWDDKDGNRIYIGGFTNKKDADLKREFGDQFEYKNEYGQERKLLSVSEFAPLFEQMRGAAKPTADSKRTQPKEGQSKQ